MIGFAVEGDAKQSLLWQVFYERAWAARADYMRDLIRGGERDPARIVSLAQQRERMHKLEMNGERDISWTRRKFTEETLPSGMPILKKTSFRGNYVTIPYYATYNLQDLVADYAENHGHFDCVVELGCGYGQNLFSLFNRGGPNVPYYGGEFTESGVAMARDLASLVPDRPYEFFHFDHLKPDLSNIPRKKRALVFTAHTIEQVLMIPGKWFDVVAGIADEVHCIHVEPFGFQMQDLGPATRAHAEFFSQQQWNRNFAAVAIEARDRGVIKLDAILLETTFPHDPNNPSSLLFWRTP